MNQNPNSELNILNAIKLLLFFSSIYSTHNKYDAYTTKDKREKEVKKP